MSIEFQKNQILAVMTLGYPVILLVCKYESLPQLGLDMKVQSKCFEKSKNMTVSSFTSHTSSICRLTISPLYNLVKIYALTLGKPDQTAVAMERTKRRMDCRYFGRFSMLVIFHYCSCVLYLAN